MSELDKVVTHGSTMGTEQELKALERLIEEHQEFVSSMHIYYDGTVISDEMYLVKLLESRRDALISQVAIR